MPLMKAHELARETKGLGMCNEGMSDLTRLTGFSRLFWAIRDCIVVLGYGWLGKARHGSDGKLGCTVESQCF